MCGLILLLVLALGGGLFVGVSQEVTPLVEPDIEVTPALVPENEVIGVCPPPSTAADLDIALSYGVDVFPSGMWAMTFNESPQTARSTAEWRSNELGALAYLEVIHYDCGYTIASIDAYTSAENLAILLEDYDAWEQTDACKVGDTRLHEFDVLVNDLDYRIRYWIEPVNPTRIVTLLLAFPAGDLSNMGRYANLLFPDIPSCSALAS